MKIKKIREIYKGEEVSLKLIKATFNKKEFKKEIVVFPSTVGILPLIDKDKIILVKQYRFPAKRELWEIPAGKLEINEKPEIGAKRELREETGFEVGKLEKILECYKSPGYSTEYIHLFKATSLKKRRQSFDKYEIIKKIKIFPLNEVLKMIKNREIIDAKTILAVFSENQ